MPEIVFYLNKRMVEIKEDVLIGKEKDLASWIREKLRVYVPAAQKNLHRYLEADSKGEGKFKLDLTPIDPSLEETKPEDAEEKVVVIIGGLQTKLLMEVVPFENGIQKLSGTPIQYLKIVDFVKAKVVGDLLDENESLLRKQLEEEDKKIEEDTKKAEKAIEATIPP